MLLKTKLHKNLKLNQQKQLTVRPAYVRACLCAQLQRRTQQRKDLIMFPVNLQTRHASLPRCCLLEWRRSGDNECYRVTMGLQ